jgi:arylsulfatase A-like enzyme
MFMVEPRRREDAKTATKSAEHGRIVLFVSAFVVFASLWCDASALAEGNRPNIIVILADDMGYSDPGCFGGEIRTPNIDGLAQGGLRFTQFYNGGRCCPTRASLLTGLYPHQAGVGRMTNDANLPGYRGRLTENTVTIAEVLRASGYRTAMVGKWHLSNTKEEPGHLRYLNNQAIRDQFSDPKTYPVGRGFESHYGPIWGVVNYFDPFSLVQNAEPVREVPKDYYITDAISDRAVEKVGAFSKGKEPFFLYVAHVAPHWPLHALEEDVKKYENTYREGWDAIRDGRLKRMKERGILFAGEAAPRNEPGLKWEDNPTREWDAWAMAVHAAMVDRMDQGIGRLVAKLRETKQLDNTLILFMSDNGASPEVTMEPGFDRPSQTRDGRDIVYPKDKQVMPGSQKTFGAIGPYWASVANTPMRFWKAEMYEGGICTPMIAHWPAGITAKGGSVTNEMGHVMDVMATCVDIAGANYPGQFHGNEITPLEGKSLLPTFRGEKREGHAMLAWEHIGTRAIREEGWKLVSRRTGSWALYDVSKDRGELNDLSDREPERVREMEAKWQHWAAAKNVLPAPAKK